MHVCFASLYVCVCLNLLYISCTALIHHLVGVNVIKHVLVIIPVSVMCGLRFLFRKENDLDRLASRYLDS